MRRVPCRLSSRAHALLIHPPPPRARPQASFTGSLHFYGAQGVHFYTRTKTVTQAWRGAGGAARPAGSATAFPTSKDDA